MYPRSFQYDPPTLFVDEVALLVDEATLIVLDEMNHLRFEGMLVRSIDHVRHLDDLRKVLREEAIRNIDDEVERFVLCESPRRVVASSMGRRTQRADDRTSRRDSAPVSVWSPASSDALRS